MSSLIKNGSAAPQTTITLDNKVKSAPVDYELVKNTKIEKSQTEIDAEILLLKKAAQEQGYAEGKKVAQAELKKLSQEASQKYIELELTLKQHYKELEEKLLEVSSQLEKHTSELAKIFESRLIILTLESLCKLAGNKEIYINIVEETIRRCLSQESYTDKIYIRLPESSSAQFKFLSETLKDNCVLIFEQELEPGKCLITSGYTTEDASLSTLLEQIKDQFLSTFNIKQKNV